MSNCLTKCLYAFFLVYFISVCRSVETDEKIEGLPYCGGTSDYSHYKSKKLMFVSTLDGHVSMLNIADGGIKEWSVSTEPGPMLSSNIHKLELKNNGQWVRMIPSLSGGLYKFNGEFIEAIPINAEHLLKSSFRYSDDLVISGGKESRTYGVEVDSGRVLYECKMDSCDNMTDGSDSGAVGDVVLVQRFTQTVRAVEPRSGTERWNFSVSQHDVKFSPDPTADCHVVSDPLSEVILKVIVPEGLVCAISKSQPGKVVWTHKFESPVVNAWRLDKGQLELVDLFGSKTPALPQVQPEFVNENEKYDDMTDSPALYVGVHKKQLYIQESVTMQASLQTLGTQYKQHIISADKSFPRIPWQPVPAHALVLGSVKQYHGKKSDKLRKALQITDESSSQSASSSDNAVVTAMSVLDGSDYVNGQGYYLYSEEHVEKSKTGLCPPDGDKNLTINNNNATNNGEHINYNGDDDEDDDTPVQIIIVSLWYWWKEVFLISLTTAIAVNVLLHRRSINFFQPSSQELVLFVKNGQQFAVKESGDSGVDVSRGYNNLPSSNAEYVSRYLTDFDPVHRLGKGGFGVVFEAKNKIDDCHYAVKRIVLPNSEESRERVMREVKALAKLDHRNIVRYFNAWLECPPPGWQEEQDKLWTTDKSTGFDEATSFASQLTPSILDNQMSDDITNGEKIQSSNNKFFDSSSLLKNNKNQQEQLKDYINNEQSDSFICFENSEGTNKDKSESCVNKLSSIVDKIEIVDCNYCDDSDVINSKNTKFSDNVFADSRSDCDNSNKCVNDSIILINSSNNTSSNSTLTTSVSDSNNYNQYNFDNNLLKRRKRNSKESRHKRPSSLSLKREEVRDLLIKPRYSDDSTFDHNNKKSNNRNGSSSLRMYLYIQMQLCRKESLHVWLQNNADSRNQKLVVKVFEQIVDAVEYVHLKGLIHRDLKPSNIFFSLDGQIKIGDFGLVTAMVESGDGCWSPSQTTPDANIQNQRSFSANAVNKSNERHTARVGTHLYMSPEQLSGKLYNYKVDIYSLGLILFELLTPFGTEMERIQTLQNLRNNIFSPEFQNSFQHEYKLLSLMLSHQPEKRPTTYGIRARPPLNEKNDLTDDVTWHFELPSRRKTSSHSSSVEN